MAVAPARPQVDHRAAVAGAADRTAAGDGEEITIGDAASGDWVEDRTRLVAVPPLVEQHLPDVAGKVEEAIYILEMAIKSRFPEIKRLFIEVQSEARHDEVAAADAIRQAAGDG